MGPEIIEMTRVSWATLEPGQTETLLGVMLCREFPAANRIRTSQGDGGVDVLVPVNDDRVDVYQIKYFATRLDASRRQQIKKSFERIRTNASVNLSNWHLTIPLNPSAEDLTWFQGVTRDAPFHCGWFGLDQVERLAAKYQDVVDYYLRDGRDRLEKSISELRLAAGIERLTTGGLVEPTDVEEPLRNLYLCLNRDDPHYRYEFEVGRPRPTKDYVSRPGLIVSTSTGNEELAVTHNIFARYVEATKDAPVAFSFQVDERDLDEESRDAWIKTLRFGSPSNLIVRNLDERLPFGLGEKVDLAWMKIQPASRSDGDRYAVRLGVFSPDGLLVSDVVVQMEAASQGILGGVRSTGIERGGAFTVEILLDPLDDVDRRLRISLSPADPKTHAPARLERGVRFLSQVHSPNVLAVGPEFGPFMDDPIEIPGTDPPVNRAFVELMDSLALIQNNMAPNLSVPDLNTLAVGAMQNILQFAALLRGETIRDTWESVELDIHLTTELPESPASQIALQNSISIIIGEQVLTMEPVTTVLLAAVLEVVEDGDVTKLIARPAFGNNTRLTVRSPIGDLHPSPVPNGVDLPGP